MSNSPAQKTMTENLHPKDKALAKIAGIQFLRLNEIALLRAVHRVFVYRRKNLYRRNILSHITEESAKSSMKSIPGAGTDESVVYANLKALQDVGIIVAAGDRKDFPEQYKQKNEALEHTVRRTILSNPVFYDFDVNLTREILKCLHEIEYVPLTKWHRTIVGFLKDAPRDTWWTYTLVESNMSSEKMERSIRHNPTDEVFMRLVEVDRRDSVYLYRITDFGLKVIDAWNKVTQLIEKHNEAQAKHRSRETATTEETA